MNNTFKLALAALALGTSACGTENRGVESVHQPVVQRADYVIDLGASNDGLSDGEMQRLAGWFDSLRLAYGDRISVDNPNPYGSDAVRQSVAAMAARYGLLLSDGSPVTSGEIPAEAVRVVVSRVVARVPGCPDWSRPASPDLQASLMSNFGCATNGNFAAMVANPQDLIEGRQAQGGVSAINGTKAVNAHRGAAPSGNGGTTIKSEGVGK